MQLLDLCNQPYYHDIRQNNLEIVAANGAVYHEWQLQGLYINRYVGDS